MNDETMTRLASMRDRLAAAAGPHRGRGRGYGEAMRAEAVAMAMDATAGGMSVRQTAKAMGIHETTLLAWMNGPKRAASTPFAEVRVVEREDRGARPPLRLFLSNGARVEGLDVPSLLAIVKALA